MEEAARVGLVLLGEMAGARGDPSGRAGWLLGLASELDEAYGEQLLAPFGLTESGEILGLLAADADPLPAVLRAALHPAARTMRWACVVGPVDAGEDSASRPAGASVGAAHEALEAARATRDGLLIRTGRTEVDDLLGGMTPALADLLAGLTPRQRVVGRLALIEGLRQSEVAERLAVRRATISVSFGRARVHSILRLAGAVRSVYHGAGLPADGQAAPAEGASAVAADPAPGCV